MPDQPWKETISVEKYQAVCDLYEFRSLRNRLHAVKGEESTKEEVIEIAYSALEELRVMVHMLHSEMTNASFVDIQNITQEKEVEKIKDKLLGELTKENLSTLFETVEKPLMNVLVSMQEAGITLDVEKLRQMSVDLHAHVNVLEQKIYASAGKEFNISSPKQLGDVLYDVLGLGSKIKKTKTHFLNLRLESNQ